MSRLLTAVTQFVEAIRAQSVSIDELNDRSRKIADLLPNSKRTELDEALRQFVGLFPSIPLVAAGLVALNCGSLVENGGDPAIAGPALLDKLPRLNETATEFYSRCRALAEADPQLLEEVRAELADQSDDPADERGWEPADLVAEHIANEGWDGLAGRYGPVIYQDHPTAVLGHMSEDVFRLGLIAHLSRSKPLRAAARARPELLAQTQAADSAAGLPYSFLTTMLRVLDDERLTVIHVEQKKGFEVRIAGLADNFQLHVLLAGALIGKPAGGWLVGERPSSRAVAECRDSPVGKAGGADVTGAFNLVNWTGLQPDGTLIDGLAQDAADHWIWNEGCPADIVPFEGRRVVLLGPSPYSRHWRAGRQFSGMIGELGVERTLPAADVKAWLTRLRSTDR